MQSLKKIKVFTMEKDMASVIGQNSKENLSAFLRRMNHFVDESWDKDVLSVALKDTILENPELVLYIHGKEILTFMIELWESKELEITQAQWALIGQLKLLGFVDYAPPYQTDGEIDTVYVIEEAKDFFYFFLKSKTSRRLMDKYENWESIVRGMMSYFGIISFQRFYFYFCKTCQEPVDDDLFHLFLSVRINLLSFGGFAMETESQVEYYQNYEVSDPEKILDSCLKNRQLDYCLPTYNTLNFIGNNNGLGDWDGLSSLAAILMDDLQIEYYRTIVMIKSCVLLLQNGSEFENAVEQFLKWCPESEEFIGKVRKAVFQLYDTVPVYHLKGWTRKELKDKNKKTPAFKVVKGGKNNSKNHSTKI